MSRFWQHFVTDGHKHPNPAYLGIQGYAVRLEPMLSERHRAEEGVQVRMVQPGSPAEGAGILEGDILLSLGDHPVGTADELFAIVELLSPEAPVPIALLRKGRLFERMLVMQGRRLRVRKG